MTAYLSTQSMPYKMDRPFYMMNLKSWLAGIAYYQVYVHTFFQDLCLSIKYHFKSLHPVRTSNTLQIIKLLKNVPRGPGEGSNFSADGLILLIILDFLTRLINKYETEDELTFDKILEDLIEIEFGL